jgi:hypothetical protein
MVLFSTGALAGPAAGQTPAAPTQPVEAPCTTPECLIDRAIRDEGDRIAVDSAVVYPFALAGARPSSVTLIAGSENRTATLTYSMSISKLASVALTASAPLSDSDAATSIVQLSGLANKARVGAQWNWGRQTMPSPERANTILTALLQACGAKGPTAGSPVPPNESGLAEAGCDLAKLTTGNPAVQNLLREYQRTAWFASLKGEVGRQTFAFVDAVSFAGDSDTKYGAAGALTFGALVAPTNVFVSLGLRLENSYADADRLALCPPGTPGQSQGCPSKVVGPPMNTRRGVFEAEVRKYLPVRLRNDHPIGVSAVLRRDWENKETSVEMPIYLVKDKKGGLSGGLSVGHVWSPTPSNRGPRFAVFVGQTFGLVPTGS